MHSPKNCYLHHCWSPNWFFIRYRCKVLRYINLKTPKATINWSWDSTFKLPFMREDNKGSRCHYPPCHPTVCVCEHKHAHNTHKNLHTWIIHSNEKKHRSAHYGCSQTVLLIILHVQKHKKYGCYKDHRSVLTTAIVILLLTIAFSFFPGNQEEKTVKR